MTPLPRPPPFPGAGDVPGGELGSAEGAPLAPADGSAAGLGGALGAAEGSAFALGPAEAPGVAPAPVTWISTIDGLTWS